MRIISGSFKGRIIKFPKSKLVRPTTDKTKESIFNTLNSYIDFYKLKVADIYAGSGSLGLESLSRDASEVHFVEKNFNIGKTLKQNIDSLDVSDRCKIFRMDAIKFTKISEHSEYDLIFADPPFFKDDVYIVVANLLKRNYLSSQGTIIIERSIQTEKEDTTAFGIKPFKKIGDSLIYRINNS